MRAAAGILALTLALAACSPRPGPATGPPLPADYRALIARAYDHLRAGEYEPAESALERAIALRSDGADAHNLLGIAHFLRENLRQAEECFLRAIRLREDYCAAFNNLGNVRFLQGNLKAAREDFKKALDIDPSSAAAHYGLAMLLFSQGKHEEGMTYLSRAIALDPDFLETNRGFASTAAVAGLASPETYYAWARAYALQENAAKAVEHLQKAREAGFKNWKRLDADRDFDKIRTAPEFVLFRQDL
jgi:tetratricopeptide (TPR) repeat protein